MQVPTEGICLNRVIAKIEESAWVEVLFVLQFHWRGGVSLFQFGFVWLISSHITSHQPCAWCSNILMTSIFSFSLTIEKEKMRKRSFMITKIKLEGEHSVECKTSAANTARSLK